MVGHSKQFLTPYYTGQAQVYDFLLFLILSDVLGEDMSRHIMHKNSIINSEKCQEKKQAGANTQMGSSDQKMATETIKNIKVSFEDMPRILEVKSEMLNDLLAFNKDMISTKSRQLETVLAFKYN